VRLGRMETTMLGAFLLGVVFTFYATLVLAMLLFGPQILELVDGD